MQEVRSLRKSNSFSNSFFVLLRKIGSNPLLLAFLLNLSAFILSILFFDIKYEVSDDYITDAVLSGAFGTGYDPQLLFGNVILGYVLVFLYKLIPTISFYFFLLISLDFISATIVLYLLFKKKNNIITICIAALFLIFYSDDLFILIQFTKAAAAAGIAGGLLILHGLWEAGKHKACYILLGSLLMIQGSLLRFETTYIYAAFLVIAFIYFAVSYYLKNREKSDIGREETTKEKNGVVGILIRFAVCLLIIGMLYGLQYLGLWLCSLDESHKDFNNFHSIRCSITDHPVPDFEAVEDEYNELGLDFIDYVMLCSWNFVDQEVYPDELVIKAADIHSNALSEIGTSFSAVVQNFMIRQPLLYPAAICIYIFVVLSLLLSKKRIYPVMVFIISLVLLVAFVFYGRTKYRVEWSIYFCAASCIITGFSYDGNCSAARLNKRIFGKNISTVGLYAVILVVLLFAARVTKIITKYNLLNCSDEEYRTCFADTLEYSGEYIPDKVGFPTISRRLSEDLIDHMENDSEHYYIVDFDTGIQDFYYNYDPWIRPEEGLFEHYAYFGGCTMRHPGERSALMANGADPDNPFKSLINDNIYLVDNWGYEYKILYIRRYFYPEAKIKLVDEIDGYKIWKVFIPDSVEE